MEPEGLLKRGGGRAEVVGYGAPSLGELDEEVNRGHFRE